MTRNRKCQWGPNKCQISIIYIHHIQPYNRWECSYSVWEWNILDLKYCIPWRRCNNKCMKTNATMKQVLIYWETICIHDLEFGVSCTDPICPLVLFCFLYNSQFLYVLNVVLREFWNWHHSAKQTSKCVLWLIFRNRFQNRYYALLKHD